MTNDPCRTLLLSLAATLVPALCAQAPVRPHANRERLESVTVLADHRVVFKLEAPRATEVDLAGSYPLTTGRMFPPDTGKASTVKNIAMKKDAAGLWSTTVGPLNPDIYEYNFVVDGMRILDPQGKHTLRITNWFLVAGPQTEVFETGQVPHGRVSYDWYPSPTLKMTRRLSVYTPPGYEGSTKRYPVLYLLHWGGGDETGADLFSSSAGHHG